MAACAGLVPVRALYRGIAIWPPPCCAGWRSIDTPPLPPAAAASQVSPSASILALHTVPIARQGAVTKKLEELMDEPCDEVFPEYITVMVSNGKTIR